MVPSLTVFEKYLDNELNNILYILVSSELTQRVELVEVVKEDMGLLEAMDMIRGLEYLSYDDRLSLGCSPWGREGSGETLHHLSVVFKGRLQGSWRDFLKGHVVIGEMALNQKRVCLDEM